MEMSVVMLWCQFCYCTTDGCIFTYFSFLTPVDKWLYKNVMYAILERRKVSSEAQRKIKKIQVRLQGKSMTRWKGRREKDLWKSYILEPKHKFVLHFNSFGLQFLKYVCLFQSKEPVFHSLHDQQLEVFEELLCCFIKPKKLMFRGKSEVVTLKRLDVKNETNHQPYDKILFGPKVTNRVKKVN